MELIEPGVGGFVICQTETENKTNLMIINIVNN